MTGTITKLSDGDVVIIGDQGLFYYLPKRTGGVLVYSKSFNGNGSFKAQDPNGLVGLKVKFGVVNTYQAFNVEELDNSNQ